MKIMKLIMGSMWWAVFCTSVAWVEYKALLNLGSGLSLVALASMPAAMVVALLRAPEGCEEADGFHIRGRNRRANAVRYAHQTRRAKMNVLRFLVAPPPRAHY